MQVFKLYVGTTRGDRELLYFLHENIPVINQMGVKISITHLKKRNMTKDVLDALSRKGISRLPVLIANNKKFIGTRNITKLFKNNLSNYKNASQSMNSPVAPIAPMHNSDDPVHSYMETIMKDDDDSEENEAEDMMRKYADAATGRGKEPHQPRPNKLETMQKNLPTNDEDNIASDDIMSSLNRTSNPGGADAAMEEAYWANQMSSEGMLDF